MFDCLQFNHIVYHWSLHCFWLWLWLQFVTLKCAQERTLQHHHHHLRLKFKFNINFILCKLKAQNRKSKIYKKNSANSNGWQHKQIVTNSIKWKLKLRNIFIQIQNSIHNWRADLWTMKTRSKLDQIIFPSSFIFLFFLLLLILSGDIVLLFSFLVMFSSKTKLKLKLLFLLSCKCISLKSTSKLCWEKQIYTRFLKQNNNVCRKKKKK